MGYTVKKRDQQISTLEGLRWLDREVVEVSLLLPGPLVRALAVRAQEQGRTSAQVLRALISQYVTRGSQ